MGEDQAEVPVGEAAAPAQSLEPSHRFRRRWLALVLLGVLLTVVAAVWLVREPIAERLIAGELDKLDLPATYKIASIGAEREVATDIVIGDPARPDLTIERIEVSLRHRFGLPAIRRVLLVRPTLRGSLRGGKASFGSLDKLLAGGGGGAFRLPDLDLSVVGGRVLMQTDYGPVAIALAGEGPLRGGFAGKVGVGSPSLATSGCAARGVVLSGSLAVRAEQPRFTGPLRLDALECTRPALRLAAVSMPLDITFDSSLDGAAGTAGLRTGTLAAGDQRAAALVGNGRFAWRNKVLNARYRIEAQGIAAPQLAANSVTLDGALRAGNGFARVASEGSVAGRGLAPGRGFDAALGSVERSVRGSFAELLLAQLRTAIAREGPRSTLAAAYTARFADGTLTLLVPDASWRGQSGAVLVALSRFDLAGVGAGSPRISGNFATGGPGLPRITGRIGRGGNGASPRGSRWPNTAPAARRSRCRSWRSSEARRERSASAARCG